MNGTYHPSATSAWIWRREQIKIIFQYSLMLVASVIAGGLLPRFLGDRAWQSALHAVTVHFDLSFSLPIAAKEFFYTVYTFFLPTLICVGIVGIFSFSSLNCLITDGVFVYLGMRTGCTISVLCTLFRRNMLESLHFGFFKLFIFLLFKLLLLAFFMLYAVQMSKYAYRLRVYSKEGRTLFHPQTVFALLGKVILCSTVLFALHLLYGCLIYFISK